jgi:branched-chain amino acid transport system substrate-binding protein
MRQRDRHLQLKIPIFNEGENMKTGMHRLATLALTFVAMVITSTGFAHHRGDDTVLIGGAISQTGRYSEPAGRNLNSIKLWVKHVNERGGLLGHKVVIKYLDDKSDKQTSIKLYEKLRPASSSTKS